MTNNVYKFPGSEGSRPALDAAPEPIAVKTPGRSGVVKKAVFGVVKALWFTAVLTWPLLRWIVALDVVFQALVMVWHWDTPGSHAGWTFALHFLVLVVLTYFVSVFKPKGVK
ncbi:KleE stable inheritance protein [Pseudomonas sp. AK106]|jgi:hypothetical protein